MAEEYLSPAFSGRTAADVSFLRQLDGRTGFSLFWLDVSQPLLEHVGAKRLLEVGAAEGQQTRWLAAYCAQRGGRLTVIEPADSIRLRRLVSGGDVTWFKEVSQTALKRLTEVPEAVFLEGDLNYATVLQDLRALQRLRAHQRSVFPLTFLSALSWPYARRDMYYEAARLPREERHAWSRRGLSPWSAGQVEGSLNAPFANAAHEGGPRNGVLTAVEDFVQESREPLRLWRLPMNFGFGILYAAGSPAERYIATRLIISPHVARLLETIEIARLNEILRHMNSPRRWSDTLKRLFYG